MDQDGEEDDPFPLEITGSNKKFVKKNKEDQNSANNNIDNDKGIMLETKNQKEDFITLK